MGKFKYPFLLHIQGDPCANYLYDDGQQIFDIEKVKEIAQARYPDGAWEVHNGAEVFYNEKYDQEEEERRINA
ncbi:hypothetical protein LCGC14_2475480 [marine sediment metagenome]|uniref:Uncharacterized protein n=1 Tax=marine sediment metagenome TaxID=412755 RepID=A0A0F9BX06_9ZZZZ